jgi:hypothetical protein
MLLSRLPKSGCYPLTAILRRDFYVIKFPTWFPLNVCEVISELHRNPEHANITATVLGVSDNLLCNFFHKFTPSTNSNEKGGQVLTPFFGVLLLVAVKFYDPLWEFFF